MTSLGTLLTKIKAHHKIVSKKSRKSFIVWIRKNSKFMRKAFHMVREFLKLKNKPLISLIEILNLISKNAKIVFRGIITRNSL